MRSTKSPSTLNPLVRAVTPLAAALLAVVCLSGICIYPVLFSAAGIDTGATSELASKLLVTAFVALLGALIPAGFMSFREKDFSISLTLVLSLTGAVFFSWLTMLIQRISPLASIGGFFGGVLNVMITALIGSVLSVMPALLATLLCVLRRIIARMLTEKKR